MKEKFLLNNSFNTDRQTRRFLSVALPLATGYAGRYLNRTRSFYAPFAQRRTPNGLVVASNAEVRSAQNGQAP